MKQAAVKGAAALAVIALAGSLWMLGGKHAPAAPATEPAQAGAPAAAVVKAVDGKALKKAVAAHKGEVVVLNLWATWCGPCVEEFPDLVKLYDQYKGKGLVVIG